MNIKPGLYLAKAVEWDLGVSENGKEFIGVTFELKEGEAAGYRITWRGFFTPKTQERTIQSLRYCGWDGHDFCNLTDLNKNLVQLDIGNDEYQGKTFARVNWVNRLGNLAIKNRMDDKARTAFAAKMKGAAMAVPKDLAVSAGNGADQADEPPPHGDDDIPF